MALLRHPISCPKDAAMCEPLPVFTAILQYVEQVDDRFFCSPYWQWASSLSVLSSVTWHLLLIGQGIDLLWQSTVTAFLIGRFIGTFLPSTIGLDGYTLYEAGRYSNQWTRVITAKGLEKFIGITGLSKMTDPTIWLFCFKT